MFNVYEYERRKERSDSQTKEAEKYTQMKEK